MFIPIILFLIYHYSPDVDQIPFYEEAYWHQEMESISGSKEIIAIANSVLQLSTKGEPARWTKIVLLYSRGNDWFYKKYLYNNRKHQFKKLYESELSLVSTYFVNRNLKEFVNVLYELEDVENGPLGAGFIEYYCKRDNKIFTKSYFSCGGRGDINGFAEGKYSLLFQYYAIGNNSDAY